MNGQWIPQLTPEPQRVLHLPVPNGPAERGAFGSPPAQEDLRGPLWHSSRSPARFCGFLPCQIETVGLSPGIQMPGTL